MTRPTAPPFIVSPTSHGGGVGRPGAHPAAHVRVDRHRQHADDDLARRPGRGARSRPAGSRPGSARRAGRAASCHSRVVMVTAAILPAPAGRGDQGRSRSGPTLRTCSSPGSRPSRSPPTTRCPAVPTRSRTCPRCTRSTATASSRRSPRGCRRPSSAPAASGAWRRSSGRRPGVYSTAVGYAGGYTPNPTYEEVCSARTGHTEVVLVVFDPAVISYEQLLKVFWEDHDPTQGMRQGNDIGTQYRSAIYVRPPEQEAAAPASRDALPGAADARPATARSPPRSRRSASSSTPRTTTSSTSTRCPAATARSTRPASPARWACPACDPARSRNGLSVA